MRLSHGHFSVSAVTTAEEQRRAQYEAYAASVALCLRARKQQLSNNHNNNNGNSNNNNNLYRTHTVHAADAAAVSGMYMQVVRLLQQNDDSQLRVLYR